MSCVHMNSLIKFATVILAPSMRAYSITARRLYAAQTIRLTRLAPLSFQFHGFRASIPGPARLFVCVSTTC